MGLPVFVFSIAFALIHSTSSIAAAPVQDQRLSGGLVCQPESSVVAVVEPGRTIRLEEVDQIVNKQIQALKEKIYALRKNALENLINHVVLETEAGRTGLSLEELKRRLTSVEATVPKEQIEEVYSENQAVFSLMSEDEAKEKIRLDLENQIRLRAFRTRVLELRGRAQIRVCLDEPVQPAVVVSERGPSLGPGDARVTIYEYSDFQCPYCRQAAATVRKLLQAYDGKVRLIFKHLPLPIHPQASVAAQAAYCAHEQGSFWSYHDRLFEEGELSTSRLKAIAVELGLEPRQFDDCLGSEAARSEVLRDVQEARKAGFQGTPTFVINGRVLRGAISLEEFKRIVELELERGKEE